MLAQPLQSDWGHTQTPAQLGSLRHDLAQIGTHVCHFPSRCAAPIMFRQPTSLLLTVLLLSACEEQPSISDPDDLETPCAERALDACTGGDERCRIVRTRMLTTVDEATVCPNSVEEVTCVAMDNPNCNPTDTEEFWTDPGGNYYWTSDGCGLPHHRRASDSIKMVACALGEGGAGGAGGSSMSGR